jgi:hypothetical protein
MRSVGEIVTIPGEVVESQAKLHKNSSDIQVMGFALDSLERELYKTQFGWMESGPFDPYDVTKDGAYVDFKWCSAKTLTISTREVDFAQKNSDSYFVFIYEKTAEDKAVFLGSISFQKLQEFLLPSKVSSGQFAWLSKLRPHLA